MREKELKANMQIKVCDKDCARIRALAEAVRQLEHDLNNAMTIIRLLWDKENHGKPKENGNDR